ncbi:hypothetical protein [Streptomyces sp. KL118A]|nr:hypothetical protein [Streptomyces sp. KL118A]
MRGLVARFPAAPAETACARPRRPAVLTERPLSARLRVRLS